MLSHGVSGSMYPSSTSFQSLLANISAAQRPSVPPKSPGSDYMSSVKNGSPPVSPPLLTQSQNTTILQSSMQQNQTSNPPVPSSPTTTLSISPSAISPCDVSTASVSVNSGLQPQQNQSISGSQTPPEDRRSSSIAALRLKAREHELRLEMLRQNGDILS